LKTLLQINQRVVSTSENGPITGIRWGIFIERKSHASDYVAQRRFQIER
jgi:hypothetical protein